MGNSVRDDRFQAIGSRDCGNISLQCQGEVIELAKHLAGQENALRPFLETLVGELEQNRITLPTLPATVTRVLALTSQREIEIAGLAAVVESDVALTTKVVGIGNTAYFARAGGPASSVEESLMRMGTQRAFNIVLMTALRGQLVPEGPLHAHAEDLWRTSLRAGVVCQNVLSEVPPWEKTGFLLGLLHSIGRWAILGFASTLSARGWTDRSLRSEILDATGDALEGPLGGLVVDSWGYSTEFSLAIRNFRHPRQCASDARALAELLSVSILISDRLDEGWFPDSEYADERLLSQLVSAGIDAARLMEIAEEATVSFEVLSKVS